MGGKKEIRMNRTEYLTLSTRLAKDLKDWIEESRDHHGLTESQLISLQDAADIIDQTTVGVVRIEEPHG